MLKVVVCAMVWGDNDKSLREKEDDRKSLIVWVMSVLCLGFYVYFKNLWLWASCCRVVTNGTSIMVYCFSHCFSSVLLWPIFMHEDSYVKWQLYDVMCCKFRTQSVFIYFCSKLQVRGWKSSSSDTKTQWFILILSYQGSKNMYI